MKKTNDVIKHITWGTLGEGNYYLNFNSEVITKVLAFLAYITPKDVNDNMAIDFSSFESYKKGLHKLHKYYSHLKDDKSKRICNLIYSIDKAVELKFDSTSDSLNNLYTSYLKESDESLSQLFDYAELNAPTGAGVNSNTTNIEISKIAKHILGRKKGNCSVVDIASGRGSFLALEASDNNKGIYYGCDPVFMNVLLSSMRLEMKNVDYHIYQDDILSGKFYKEGLRFDKVFADFPWMAKTGNEDMSYLKDVEMPVTSSNRGDWRFVNMAINLMSKKGKAVIVMNEGSLFNQLDETSRAYLIEKGMIEAIISMPAGTRGNINIPYSLMVLSYGNENVRFIDATDCYADDSHYKKIDADRIIGLYDSEPTVFNNKNKKNMKLNAILIKKSDIKKQNNILSVGRYFESNKVSLINPTPLIDVCSDIFRGYQTTSAQIKKLATSSDKKEYELLQLSNIDENGIHGDLIKIPAPSKGIDKFLLQENDIVISSKSLNVKVALVKNVGNRKIIPTGSMIVVRANKEIIDPTYLFVFLNSNTGKTKLTSIQTGTVIMSINANALERMEISNPEKEIQAAISDRYNQLRFNYDVAMKQVSSAKQKMDSLYEEEVGDLD